MDAAYILAAVRILLNEYSSVKCTDDQINKWVQEAAIDISTKTLGYEVIENIATVANTLECSEPDNTIKVHSCLLLPSPLTLSLIDSLEFDTSRFESGSICHVSGDVYAIAYRQDSNRGKVVTVSISSVGIIAAVDSGTFSTHGLYPVIKKVADSTTYVIAHRDSNDYGNIETVTITDAGDITTGVANWVFNSNATSWPQLYELADNYFAIVYTDSSSHGWIKTVKIENDGTIGSEIDNLEFDGTQGEYATIAHVTGDIYVIAYTGPNDDGWLCTVDIDSTGNIGAAVIDTLEFDTADGDYPTIVGLGSRRFLISYRGADNDGFLATIIISAAGDLGAVLDTLEFDTSNVYSRPSTVSGCDDGYAVVGYAQGLGGSGYLQLISVESDGDIEDSAALNTLEFETNMNRGYLDMITVGDNYYAVIYAGPGIDGWIRTFRIVASEVEHKGLSRIHPRLIHHVIANETGEPVHYYHHHGKVGIWPLPDGTYTVKAYFSKVTDDITDLPSELRLSAIPYCLAMARLSEGWEDDFEMFITMYLNSLLAHRPDRGQYKLDAVDARDEFRMPEGKVINA